MARPRPRALFLALILVSAGAIVAFAVMPNGLFRQTGNANSTAALHTESTAQEPDGGNQECASGEAGAEAEAAQPCELGYVNPRKEAKFERTVGEADRGGSDNPASEQVDNRAIPRGYVDDKLALKGRQSFVTKPKKLGRTASLSSADYHAYTPTLTVSSGAWTALGPVNTNSPGESGQFFDPVTQTGPSTSESGRVTALAIDPNCGKASAPAGAPCRLWVAAAGGGIWRTNDAMAATPAWIAPPDALPTNSFGSLIVDPNDATGNTLYAGSGEPNGSGDSEAGLGLFKSTNGGATWTL